MSSFSVSKLIFSLSLVLLPACSSDDDAANAPTKSATVASPATRPPSQTSAGMKPTERFIFAFIDADIEVGPAPLRVQFGTYDPHQSMMNPTYRWDFGDGSPISTKRSPVHVFEKPGNYDVKLFVEDDGATDEDSVEIQVEQPEAE